MIITEMGSGLGNQMNVYAAARRVSVKGDIPLFLDTSWFDTWPKYFEERHFGLGKFNISAEIASKKQIRKFVYKTHFRYVNKIFQKLRLFERNVYRLGRDFKTPEEILKLPSDVYLRGYYNYHYWDDIKDVLKRELQLKGEYLGRIKDLLAELRKANSVSVHVRRGDLIKMRNTVLLDKNYYDAAVKAVKEKIKNPKFYIFSDDILWCKENFTWLENARFVEGFSVEEDFELMKSCKHNITANSALSWWAAYLNGNFNKIVIAPKTFFHKQGSSVDSSINVPPNWIQI